MSERLLAVLEPEIAAFRTALRIKYEAEILRLQRRIDDDAAVSNMSWLRDSFGLELRPGSDLFPRVKWVAQLAVSRAPADFNWAAVDSIWVGWFPEYGVQKEIAITSAVGESRHFCTAQPTWADSYMSVDRFLFDLDRATSLV